MVATGKVLNFDEFRGYGFISSKTASGDVFVHANDLLDDKSLLKPGVLVEFEIEEGERGPKASDVRIREPQYAEDSPPTKRESVHVGANEDEAMCDVLSGREFRTELTDMLLEISDLTASQILQIRRRLEELACSHNWVEH